MILMKFCLSHETSAVQHVNMSMVKSIVEFEKGREKNFHVEAYVFKSLQPKISDST